MPRTLFRLMLALVLCGSGCQRNPSQTLVLTGSSTVAPLAAEIGKRFEQAHPGVRIDVQTGGSSRGLRDAREGLADLGMVSRDLTDDERDFHVVTIARDGIAMVVHRDNPIEALAREQIIAIYTDKINNWYDVGGNSAPIAVVSKAEGRSTLQLFLEHHDLTSEQIHPDVITGDNEQVIKTVSGNPHSIGYVSIGAAEYSISEGVPLRMLPCEGVSATLANVRSGKFPLSRPLNIVLRDEPTGLTKEFLEFAKSTACHDLVEKLHYVPPR